MATTSMSKDGRGNGKPKTTSTISWVSDKLAAGAARVNGGEFQDVEIAVVKATNHDITPPKEKHVRTLREIIATSSNRKKVIYIVHALYERLTTPNETWLVVLKALMVFHKLLKSDSDGNFKQEMIRYKEKRKVTELMRLNNFADRSQKESWDFSAFVRVYSSYLDERLSVFESIKFDVDRDGGGANVRFKTATGQELLDELPRVQKMLQRVLACVPEGAAAESDVVMEALRALLTECFRLYRVISEGVINLAEQFFEMDRVDASKGLELYRESINSSNQMQTFFNAVQNLRIGHQIQFPQLTPPPEDFLSQMEEYVKGATGRTAARKFPSTVSRNARGTPSAALAAPSSDGGGQPTTKLVVNLQKTTEEKPKEYEQDLLGLDALDLSVPAQPTDVLPERVLSDPFGDTVFQTPDATKDGGFLGDWGASGGLGSPVGTTSVVTEQNASPFDDFFGGGPMPPPPPPPDSSSPGSFIAQTAYPSPMQGFSTPAAPQMEVFPTAMPASNNPFSGHESTVLQPQPQAQLYQQPIHPSPMPVYQHTSAAIHGANGTFTGPGALADPFDGLTPSIQKKPSFALPGVPMRQESMGSNPFQTTANSMNSVPQQQQGANGQQDISSFF